MDKITFCIPSKNNRRYLEACIPSIRRNSFRDDHDIMIFVDADNDGTVEWLESVREKYNINYTVNDSGYLYGIGKAYDHCITKSKTDIFMIFHADMMLGKNADLEAFKYLEKGKVVCSTRIEPPLHPEGPEKIIENFGMWPEEDIEDGWKEKEFDKFVEESKIKYKDKTTNGCFAPWMMYKKDFLKMGGHDTRFHSCREDSDVFNRCVLAEYDLIQSWESFVYHLTARAGQFQHGKLTKDNSLKSKEWRDMMDASTREFYRKWGSIVLHDEYMMPIIAPKYDIAFVAKNCNYAHLHELEPWCSTIYVDYKGLIHPYVTAEQDKTVDDLKEKVKFIYENQKIDNDVIVEFDCKYLNQNRIEFITKLGFILNESAEVGGMEFDIFKLKIKSLKTYEKELIGGIYSKKKGSK